MRIIEDGDPDVVVGRGDIVTVYNEIVSLGVEENEDFTYDISRLSHHPEDAMNHIKSEQVPAFIQGVLEQLNVGESEADNNLLTLLSAVAANYLDRHDRTWYRAAVEKPIEDLIKQIAEAKGTTVIEETREIVKIARSQVMARIYTSAIRSQLEADMTKAETPEQLKAVVAGYKQQALTTLNSLT